MPAVRVTATDGDGRPGEPIEVPAACAEQLDSCARLDEKVGFEPP